MQIEQVLNNNVVQALDNNVEYIVMGKGLGFQKKVGDLVDKEKIEKTFVLENTEAVEEWSRVYVNLPDADMQVFLNILTFAEAVLQTSLIPLFSSPLPTTYITLLKEVERVFLCRILWLGRFENFILGSMKLGNKPFV